MAGTRLWVSGIALVELLLVASWSLWYGLCQKNNDILCLIFETKTIPKQPTALPFPSWWKTKLRIHLYLEEPLNPSTIAKDLERWMDDAKLDEWPYFGSTKIHMRVVSRRKWPENNVISPNSTDTIWNILSEQTPAVGDAKFLDWILYVPSSSLMPKVGNRIEQDIDNDADFWSAWRRGNDKLLTILKDSTKDEQQGQMAWNSLQSYVGPWLRDSTATHVTDPTDQLSEKDYFRKLQLSWHQIVAQDLKLWEPYLTEEETKMAFSYLGKVSESFADRFRNLQIVHSIVKAAADRQDLSLHPEFPLEHYAAIFFPLLFPLLMPFFATFLKEAKRYKRKSKEKMEAGSERTLNNSKLQPVTKSAQS